MRHLALRRVEPIKIEREKTVEEIVDEIVRRPTMDELWQQYAGEQELEPEDAVAFA